MNFYQSPGWGSPITAEAGFRGKLSNIDLSSDLTVTHITIDKSAKVQGGNCPGDSRHPQGGRQRDALRRQQAAPPAR